MKALLQATELHLSPNLLLMYDSVLAISWLLTRCCGSRSHGLLTGEGYPDITSNEYNL